jgi:hypothetical protein
MICAVIIVVISLMGGAAGPRAAQEDSDCYQFTGNAQISLKSGITMSGTAPATFCSLSRGEKYRLTATGFGLERRMGTLSISSTGSPRVSGIRLSTSGRNLVPGLGYYDIGLWEAAITDELTLAASLYFLYREHREYEHLENRYNIYMDDLNSTSLLESKQILERAAQEAARDVNVQNAHRKRLAAVCAYIYGWQLLDPFFLAAPPKTEIEGGNVIDLRSPRSSRAKAFMLSLLRPGRGQFYQGKKGRGAAFNVLTMAGVHIALDYHNKYDIEESRYELLIERHDEAETLEEKRSLASRASAQWEEVEKAKNWRNAAYVITAGIWCINVFETLFDDDGEAMPSTYSLEAGPLSTALVIRF